MKIILYFLLIPFVSCSQTVSPNSDSIKSDAEQNTVINIHLKHDSDRAYCYLEKSDRFALTFSGTDKFDVKIDTSKEKRLSYIFHLSSPYRFGFNGLPFYIEPGSVTDISFEHFGRNQYKAMIQEVEIIGGKSNSALLYKDPDGEYIKRLRLIKKEMPVLIEKLNTNKSSKILAYFDSLANGRLKLTANYNPDFMWNEKRSSFISQTYLEGFYGRWVIEFISQFSRPNLFQSKNTTIAKFISLNREMSKKDTTKLYSYFDIQKRLYEAYYKPKWKSDRFSTEIISQDIQHYDTLTQQYYYTLLLSDKMNQFDKLTYDKTLSKITNSHLNDWVNRFHQDGGPDNLMNATKDILVYDKNKNPVKFSSLLKNVKQQYLYFDFSGSWCVPCMKETEQWTKTDQWIRHSKTVKPYWIFFENNFDDWLKVVKKYNLPGENCFVITNNSLQVAFSSHYDWAGEFPHHFLFTKDGKLVDMNAPGLPGFKEGDLPRIEKKVKEGLSVPPPPPRGS